MSAFCFLILSRHLHLSAVILHHFFLRKGAYGFNREVKVRLRFRKNLHQWIVFYSKNLDFSKPTQKMRCKKAMDSGDSEGMKKKLLQISRKISKKALSGVQVQE